MWIEIIETPNNRLPEHVRDMGVRPGQKYDAMPAMGTRLKALSFQVMKDGHFEWCTVMPKNYRVL